MELINFLKDFTDIIIFSLLLLMSFIMLYCSIERSLFLKQINIGDYNNQSALELDLTNGLTPIYTIGATAPFIGLLGTVIGILITFYDMGIGGDNIAAEKILLGLAMALKATAAGIFVAIPAVIFYNSILSKIDAKKLAWQAQQTNISQDNSSANI